nr:SdpI family protein [Propionicimonas sp.]
MDYTVIAIIGFLLLLVDWAAFSVVCILGSRPVARRNAWSGIRIPSLMESDEAWIAGHRAALYHVRMGSIALLPPAVIAMLFVSQAPVLIAGIQWVLAIAGLAWILVATGAAAKAAKSVSPSGRVG